MKRLILEKHNLCLLALSTAILLTVLYDLWLAPELRGIDDISWPMFLINLAFRTFTYVALFASCRLLMEKLNASPRRTFELTAAWSITGLLLAAFVWWCLAFGAEPYNSPALKRFIPDTLADFASGWTMAEVAIGKEPSKIYTWVSAIGSEAIAIIFVSFLTAKFLAFSANRGAFKLSYATPIFAFILLMIYSMVVPWSFVWDFDLFIGDAVIGAMLFNGYFFVGTILFGGLTAPAVWVGLIAITNLQLLKAWETDETG